MYGNWHVPYFLEYLNDGYLQQYPLYKENTGYRGWFDYFRKECDLGRLRSLITGANPPAKLRVEPVVDYLNTFFEWTDRMARDRGATPEYLGAFLQRAPRQAPNNNFWYRRGWTPAKTDLVPETCWGKRASNRWVPVRPFNFDLELRKVMEDNRRPTPAEANVLFRMLFWVMRGGFHPVAECRGGHIVGRVGRQVLASFEAHKTATEREVYANPDQYTYQTREPSYAWRGDSRSWNQIQAQGGRFAAKVDVANRAFRDSWEFDETWHPFRDLLKNGGGTSWGRFIYYRKGQADNCLHTAVSMTRVVPFADGARDKYMTNVCFPKLPEVAADKRTSVSVTLRNVGARPRLADVVRLYFIEVPQGTWIFDTAECQRRQQKDVFPEVAVRGIDGDKILGWATFVRVYHTNNPAELTDQSAFCALPVAAHSQTVQGRPPLMMSGNNLFQAALSQVFEAHWSAAGAVRPYPRQIDVTRVDGVDVDEARGNLPDCGVNLRALLPR